MKHNYSYTFLTVTEESNIMKTKKFSKFLVIFVTVLLCSALPAFSQQSEIDKLRAKVERLQNKVERLEKRLIRIEKLLLSITSANQPNQQFINGNGWKSLQNWRKLEKGMSKAEVKRILGKPGKISVSPFGETWYYPDVLGGSVSYENGRVEGWREQ